MTTNSHENLNFCDALRAVKAGWRAQRAGWNGKGLFVWLNKGIFHGPYLGFDPENKIAPGHPTTIEGVSVSLFEHTAPEDTAMRLPHFCLSHPTGTFVAWAPSQTDMLASDWMIEERDQDYYDAKEWEKPLTKSARGYVHVDRQALRVLAALKEFAVSPPMPMSRNGLAFMVVHPDLPEVLESEPLPSYRAHWDDKIEGLVFTEFKPNE